MKINDKILCLPPFISTSWSNVSSVIFKNGSLVINLKDAESVTIPNLSAEIIDSIFIAHATYVESHPDIQEKSNNPLAQLMNQDPSGETPFKIGFSTTDGLGAALQHNPSQSDIPDLPQQMLEKLGAIAKIIAPEDIDSLPKPEPHCNCIHCQIARAIQNTIHNNTQVVEIQPEEEISDEDLKFPEWDITQTGDKLFSVVNRLDDHEKYNVYLGHPVGCTCGKSGCAHILAVLKS
jgi:hypothetical protein